MIRIKYWNEEREDPDVDIFNINQNVQDTVIHVEVDEEQWRKITKGSKRQATWVWFPTMSGLRFPDTPHAQNTAQRSTRLTGYRRRSIQSTHELLFSHSHVVHVEEPS